MISGDSKQTQTILRNLRRKILRDRFLKPFFAPWEIQLLVTKSGENQTQYNFEKISRLLIRSRQIELKFRRKVIFLKSAVGPKSQYGDRCKKICVTIISIYRWQKSGFRKNHLDLPVAKVGFS